MVSVLCPTYALQSFDWETGHADRRQLIWPPYFKYVTKSEMKQDGVFAKRNIREGELISYYSGVIFNPKNNPIFFKNQSIFEAWEAFSNSFYFKITSTIIFIKWEF